MADNKWFTETFLTSLFERIGTNNPTWLTAKQTAICTSDHNMKCNQMTRSEKSGGGTHNTYTTLWNGREVVLQYSKKSGTGTIVFYNTDAEKVENAIVWESNKIKKELDKFSEWKINRPERLERELSNLKLDLESRLEGIKDDLEGNFEIVIERYEEVKEIEMKINFIKSL